jgi:anaerobic selenocysteine-containing dehydrogenase
MAKMGRYGRGRLQPGRTGQQRRAVYHEPGRRGASVLHRQNERRPFPEHYEPIESPIGTNPLHPDVVSSPVARIYHDDIANMGKADAFPYVATTYSITELFRHWTKHALLNAIAQPDQFIEIGEALARKGIAAGDTVKVMSKRGFIKAKAVVTKRLQTLTIDGKQVDTIGIPVTGALKGHTQRVPRQYADAIGG